MTCIHMLYLALFGIRWLSVIGPHFLLEAAQPEAAPPPRWELLAPAANASMSSRLFFLCPSASAPLSRSRPIRRPRGWGQLGPLWSWLGQGDAEL